MPETSIVFKAYDQISGTMKSISGNSKALSKEYEDLDRKVRQLGQRNDSFNKSFAETSTKAMSARKAMQDAEKAFRKTGDSQAELDFKNAKQQYKDLTDAAKAYEEASKSTRKEISSVQDQMRKLSDGGGGGGGGSGGDGLSGLGSGLLKAGLMRELGNSVSQFAGTYIESAIGQPMATAISSTLSGAATGAAAGALLGAPGMLAGAAIGGLAGAISAGSQIYAAKDDAFKGYVQDAYNGRMEDRAATLTSGSAIAGGREQTQMAFAQRFGSDQAATDYLGRVKNMAANTNYDYDEITGYSKKLLNSYGADETLKVLMRLSDATAGLNLSGSDVDTMISGLSRMRTTNKATQEYLNYFSERGVDVYQALAESTGKDKSKIAGMITKGSISGTDAAQSILDFIDRQFGGLSEKLSTTYTAMVNNLEDAKANVDAAMGEGYNEERKKGIQAQSDFLSGSSGERMEEANRAMGAWQASLENAKEKAIQDAVSRAMSSNAYRQAQAEGDAAKMGEMIARAQVQGQNEYNASEGARLELETQKTIISGIRDDTALRSEYYDAGYTLGNEFTKGRAAAMSGNRSSDSVDVVPYRNSLLDQAGYYDGSHAFGLKRVPYDGYRAVLHQDEQVLTAAEARGTPAGSGPSVIITGNEFHVRSDSDVKALASELVRELRHSGAVYAGG